MFFSLCIIGVRYHLWEIAPDPNTAIEQYADNYFELHYKLEDLFGRNIDLLTDQSFLNPYFIKGIEQTKQLIYTALDSKIFAITNSACPYFSIKTTPNSIF